MNEKLKDADSIEAARLEIEKRRLVLEEWRVKQEQRFTNKYLAIILTSAISIAGVIVALSNVKVAQVSKEREIKITSDQHEKNLNLELSKLLSQNSEKINGDENQRNLLRTMIITAFFDKQEKIFQDLSNAASNEEIRKYWRAQAHSFVVAAKESASTAIPTTDKPLAEGKVQEAPKIIPKVEEKSSRSIGKTILYNFSIWLDIPDNKKGQIEQVTYIFNHPSFGSNNRRSSSNEGDGFRTGYEGWGAIDDVVIHINSKDGTKDTMHLNMIKALGW